MAANSCGRHHWGNRALVLIGLSFKKHKSAMLVVGSCSAAISDACHPSEDEDLDQASLGLLMWGETLGAPAWEMENFLDEIGEDRGRCSFTSLVSISFMPRSSSSERSIKSLGRLIPAVCQIRFA